MSRYNSYQEYLASPQWKDLRLEALELADYRCERCHQKGELHVHHFRYPQNYEYDDVDNLEVLCRNCHRKNHNLYECPFCAQNIQITNFPGHEYINVRHHLTSWHKKEWIKFFLPSEIALELKVFTYKEFEQEAEKRGINREQCFDALMALKQRGEIMEQGDDKYRVV